MPRRKKVFYIVSNIHKSAAFEWTALALNETYNLTFILLNPDDSFLADFLKKNRINVIFIHYRNNRDLPAAFFRLCLVFMKSRPDVVHTHLFDATLSGLSAAWITRIAKRVYTRHNSTFHHVYFPDAVKYDKFTNWLATDIVSISPATDEVLLKMEQVQKEKLSKIPHGFDFQIFDTVTDREISALKAKWNIGDHHPVVGVVARHIEWKGVQYIATAFKAFRNHHPDAILVLANATGPYHQTLVEMLSDVPSEYVVQIPFEENAPALYKIFDLYVHAPLDPTIEAFGQTYVEALAAGIPSVFSLSGIAPTFIVDGKNALVVDFKNAEEIEQALLRLWGDRALQNKLVVQGRKDVHRLFDLQLMIAGLKKLYDE